jgi:hypothetical protein
MGLISSTETSVRNYCYSLLNNPDAPQFSIALGWKQQAVQRILWYKKLVFSTKDTARFAGLDHNIITKEAIKYTLEK